MIEGGAGVQEKQGEVRKGAMTEGGGSGERGDGRERGCRDKGWMEGWT